jgi:alpha-beta hydrolase superfamily lysophospholipase
MGGNLVIRYAIDYRPMVAGVVSSSPWLRLNNSPSELLVKLSRMSSKFFPNLTVPNRMSAFELTHDKQVVEEYLADPLVHNRISVRLFKEITESGKFILLNRHKITSPLLLMHGSADKITSCKATSDFTNFTSDFTTFKMWKGAYHELHNEFEKVEIFQYILRWIERLPSVQQI